jgi:hypothetical protein
MLPLPYSPGRLSLVLVIDEVFARGPPADRLCALSCSADVEGAKALKAFAALLLTA